jgi:uncharacterized BrkB/YihY/UPF0761 family membrane protein
MHLPLQLPIQLCKNRILCFVVVIVLLALAILLISNLLDMQQKQVKLEEQNNWLSGLDKNKIILIKVCLLVGFFFINIIMKQI